MTVSDDATINDQDLLYRRIHPKQLAEDIDGSPRLSSAAFKPNQQDELTLSAYLLTALAQIPANPSDCALPGAGHTLAELGVGDVRCLGLGVVRDPVTRAEVPNPCDPAHALITGFIATRKAVERQARALAAQARWPCV